MVKKEVTREQLESIIELLKVAERPEKKVYKRKEAITELLPEIRRLRNKKKLSYAEIAQVISTCSDGEIKPRASELERLITEEANQKSTVSVMTKSQERKETPPEPIPIEQNENGEMKNDYQN